MKEASARICANVQASPPESLLSVAGSVYADERTAKAGVKSACDGSGAHGVLSSESEALFRGCEPALVCPRPPIWHTTTSHAAQARTANHKLSISGRVISARPLFHQSEKPVLKSGPWPCPESSLV